MPNKNTYALIGLAIAATSLYLLWRARQSPIAVIDASAPPVDDWAIVGAG